MKTFARPLAAFTFALAGCWGGVLLAADPAPELPKTLMTERGTLLLTDDFKEQLGKEWRVAAPVWETVDGLLKCDGSLRDVKTLAGVIDNYREYVPELQREISPVGDAVAARRVLALIRELRPDVLHTHTALAANVRLTPVTNASG